jgi:hypothetical protein
MNRLPLFAIVAGLCGAAEAKPVKIERNSAALEFTYEWSSEAAAVPALNRRLQAEAAKAYREALANANQDQLLAKQQKRDYNPEFYSMSWTTAGQSPRLLSLQNELGTFIGGAHPNSNNGALLWDRRLNQQVSVDALFLQRQAFNALTRVRYCALLNAERKKRRQGEMLGGDFDQCPKYSELAITPSDKDKDGLFDTIAFVASPYVAGPYVEGEYEIGVPVTRQLIAGMKPAYRVSFAAQRQ